MIVFEVGERLGRRSLGGILRERWRALQESQAQRLARQEKLNTPDEEPTAREAPLGDYDGDPGLDGVTVEFAALSRVEFDAFELRFRESIIPSTDESEGRAEVTRDFVAKSLRSIEGLERADGSPIQIDCPPSPGHLDLLENNKLTDALFMAGMHLHLLSGEEKKTCGALGPSTSQALIATPVPRPGAASRAVGAG